MPIQSVTTKLISTLGNKESLIPIIVKDGVDSASLTYNSYKAGGIVEGTDRAIDEFGTQAIWIGGIPFFKKLADWTIYKNAKINPNVDTRVIQNREYAAWAAKNAKGIIDKSGQSVKSAIDDCLADGGKKMQNLYQGKIIGATALTLATYFLLTKLKQKNTKTTVLKSMSHDTFTPQVKQETNIFSQFYTDKNSNPSFKGIAKKCVDGVMFNPVHNMKIIDAGITAERLACSRNPVEFAEHAIKEGAFLFTLYGLGGRIESGINKFAQKVLNKPIDLDIDVLMDKSFEQALGSNKILSDIAQLPEKSSSLTDKLNFIINNPDNALVQAAKKSKIISTVKDKAGNSVVDTSKFINTDDLSKLADKMKDINNKFTASGESVSKFLSKTKLLKVGSVMANVGISCVILGYLIPKAVYKYREMKTGSSKFHVAENIKAENTKAQKN